MQSDIRIGTTFPDYELPDHTGTRRRLSELQAGDPMILVLARGYYCPEDRWQHRRLVDFYPELKVGYTRIVTISTDKLLETAEFRDGVGASGRSCRIPVARYRRTWTSPSTPTPATIR